MPKSRLFRKTTDSTYEQTGRMDSDNTEIHSPRRRARLGVGRYVAVFLGIIFMGGALVGGVVGGRLLRSTAASSESRWMQDLEPVDPEREDEIIFTVERGWSLSRTAQALADAQLIRSAESFIRLGRQEGQSESIKAGSYLLSPSMDGHDVLYVLVKGSVLTTRFTIPEGYTLRQIAKVFAEKGVADADSFWTCVREGEFAYDFLEGLPPDEHRLEGYLFPDTYLIELNEDLESVINRMLRRYAEVWESLPERKTDMNDRDALILASIIQNETKLDEERPIVGAVFLNRLRQRMPLQSCSTVQYYFDEPKYPLLTADTQIEFPYNTYLYPGLPPGPVGCPGRASLIAAMTPAQTEYLYFVARDDGSGGHYFSRSLTEHNRAVAQARANRSGR